MAEPSSGSRSSAATNQCTSETPPAPGPVPCAFCNHRDSFKPSQILATGDAFFLCAPKGQLINGYLMVVAWRCGDAGLRALNSATAAQLEELSRFEGLIARFYREELGVNAMTFYEQGRAGGGSVRDPAGGFPHHAHYCGLPSRVDPTSILLDRFRLRAVPVSELSDLPRAAQRQPYIFVRNTDANGSKSTVYLPTDAAGYGLLESFRFKEVAAEVLGISAKAQWRRYPGELEIEETIKSFSAFAALNPDNWPGLARA